MKLSVKKPALLIALMLLTFNLLTEQARGASQSYFQLKIYHYKTKEQQAALNTYLQSAYVPALHRAGFKRVGVFGTLEKDTADRRIYVLIPVSSLAKIEDIDKKLSADHAYTDDAAKYRDAVYNNPPYSRLEVIILKAFSGMPQPAVPVLAAPKAERIYELRSYESPTEQYHANKVAMFNTGDEIGLFNRLGFNAVFYSSVVAGSRMPNLMYMTVYANMPDRDNHWKAFGADAQWKTLSAKEEYKNNVSKIDDIFLQAADYSDF